MVRAAHVGRASGQPMDCARGGAAALLILVTALVLAGAAARPSSGLGAPLDSASHVGAKLAGAVGADVVVAPRSSHHEPAPGQRVTPGALPAVPIFGLLAALLLVAASQADVPRPVPQRRLPLRRGPPRDAFSR